MLDLAILRRLVALLLTLACIAGAPAAAAENDLVVVPSATPPAGTVYKSVLALDRHPGAMAPQLRGPAVEVDSNLWPATFYVEFDAPGGEAMCTAALVGPRVVLTAAHCVPPGGDVTFQFNGFPYGALCVTDTHYPADESADFALCKSDVPIVDYGGFHFERIDLRPMDSFLSTGLQVVPIHLGGFGCTVQDGDATFKYLMGVNQAPESSNSSPHQIAPSNDYYRPKQKDNLLTEDNPKLANICPGDSGGPAFQETGSGRSIVAVNSRVFKHAQSGLFAGSLLSATGGPDFAGWVKQWAADEKLQICGVNENSPSLCHD